VVDRSKEWDFLYWRARWRKKDVGLRDTRLRKFPICEKCHHNASEVVHHIVDHRGSEKLFFDYNNLQALCKPCHDEITGSGHGFNRKPKAPSHVTPDGKIINQGY
jgi:5-methylcytosine-specific restriction protein A